MRRGLLMAAVVTAAVWLWPLVPSEATSPPVEGASPLPGAGAFPAELATSLDQALLAKGREYEPRTEHFNEDGSPRYTNRLILESSPYLLQHAHNPVNWYPWGDEAFETARRLGRPVLLSVGYSTCHWCHVMERESFEDVEIATYLNENYVAIKVDREERPDVDSIYMTAVQILNRRGGWPMTVWLTADRQPFYGATYIPPRDGDRGVGRGFLSVLRVIRGAWDTNRDQIVGQASRLSTMIASSLEPSQGPSAGQLPDRSLLTEAAEQFRESFDAEYGGLRRAPKFPSTLPIGMLLRAHAASGEQEYLEMAELTLEKMAAGGMFDQVGGGFHRYSTDVRWLVPHFEKMLYDNALLVIDYLEGYQATGRAEFGETARRVLEYVAREMTSPEGGFYSATDADSANPSGHTEEGWFFTWTPEELESALGPEEAPVVAAFYGVSPEGNFEGRSILHQPRGSREVAAEAGVTESDLEKILEVSRARLYQRRALRPSPLRDDKILTAWNGLMISAFARGGQVLAEPRFVEIAERAAEFLLRELREDGRLRRTWLGGVTKQDAFLDDYAFLIAGLLDLAQASSDSYWLGEAKALQEQLDRHYWDAERGGYYLTAIDHEAMLAREKPLTDGAEPSGNGVTLLNQYRLAELTTEDEYRSRADWTLKNLAGELSERGALMSRSLMAVDFRLGKPKEIVLVAPDSKEQAEPFLEVLRRSFVPNKVVVLTTEGELDRLAESVPFVAGKLPKRGQATAYVCEAYVCKLPTTDVEVFEEQLRSRN